MAKVTHRLSREDWILAGFRALVTGGIAALRVEPVARTLGASKGSFYWHFSDPADWRGTMLAYWEARAFTQIVDSLAILPPGAARLSQLVVMATSGNTDPSHGGTAAEPALRGWARFDAEVAAVVTRVDAGRVAYVAECLRDSQVDAAQVQTFATLFYAAYLGLQALNGPSENDALVLQSLLLALLPKNQL